MLCGLFAAPRPESPHSLPMEGVLPSLLWPLMKHWAPRQELGVHTAACHSAAGAARWTHSSRSLERQVPGLSQLPGFSEGRPHRFHPVILCGGRPLCPCPGLADSCVAVSHRHAQQPSQVPREAGAGAVPL